MKKKLRSTLLLPMLLHAAPAQDLQGMQCPLLTTPQTPGLTSITLGQTNSTPTGASSVIPSLGGSANGGYTALILAVQKGHTNVVRILLQKGASKYKRDNFGRNAMDYATSPDMRTVLQYL